ncbi:sn-glycerol-3-phosphate ABC transporter ATP-binding protein UgpC [Gluconacetobacter azotocaptans]|uniref:ABC transporter ATP-binding protein n=1 Tax=Gluconacetobacter azotocaptans TaxID=142834 RepID=UPI001956DFE8|nr:sn-glycerol-3-phosphate ABC transporter ATP-binding protein UgpC [Gluconacetobacter azotocaptans]MBM9400547.1 sn-glycerol-3-phosphate ABC transporter ATP-binding protein UgpC [Gluconacetobacter azotocaptans]
MATVELRDIRKTYSDEEIIKGVSLTIHDREFVVFVGPSGCGKSTLLRMIAGLEDISAGELLIDGVRANEKGPAERGLAMVFQSYALYPHMNVYRNMEFSLRLAGMPVAERRQRIADVARILQLEPYLDHKPGQLSGGQRQRVAIGRAIVRNPKVFLFDEPLSNLDAALRGQMRVELATLHRRLGATTIYVTHDQVEAMTMADRIVVLRKGVVEQIGTPLDLYHRPRNLFVAQFMGSPTMNVLPAHIVSVTDHTATVTTGPLTVTVPVDAGSLQPGAAVTLGVRPEHIGLDVAGAPQGLVEISERLGAATLLHVRLSDGRQIVVQTGGDNMNAPDSAVGVTPDPAHCHLFDADGAALDRLAAHPLQVGS